MTEFTYWFNGEFLPEHQAVIPVNDRGYRLGDGVFDTERTFNGEIFRLAEHLERLERSLRYTRIDPGVSLAELARLSKEAVERNRHLLERHGDFWVTQNISRDGRGGANVAIIVEPLPFARFAPFYDKGIPLVIPPVRSSANQGLDPKLKAISRLNMVLADLEGKAIDADSLSVLVDEHGNLAEVLYGNLFVVRGGKIRTPGSRAILEGVSRMTTLELIASEGFPASEADLQPYDLFTADEAFVTTTSYCILPVASLNGREIGREAPGPVTEQLTRSWNHRAGLDIAAQMRRFGAPKPAEALTLAT
jgi:branched-chain amino acid aminotransferase